MAGLALIRYEKWRKWVSGGRWQVGRAQGTTTVPLSLSTRGGGRITTGYSGLAHGGRRESEMQR